MPAKHNPETGLWESPVEGPARLKPVGRQPRAGKGTDEVFELEDGTRLSGRIRARPRQPEAASLASTGTAAATAFDFVLQFALLDAEGKVARDAAGNPVLFAPFEVAQAPALGAPDWDRAIEEGWEIYLAQMPARIRAYGRALELAALHGEIQGEG